MTGEAAPPPAVIHPAHRSFPERAFERALFASRWLLVPFFIGLIGSLALLLVRFAFTVLAAAQGVLHDPPSKLTLEILSLVDLTLIANLVLMVAIGGYETFVARLDIGLQQRLAWMGRVNFGSLKLRVMASIAAISAIHLLEDFMNASTMSDRTLGWRVGIHLAFVVSGLMLAAMDRVAGDGEEH